MLLARCKFEGPTIRKDEWTLDWQVRCGYSRCRGVIGTFHYGKRVAVGNPIWTAHIPAGYVEVTPGHWRLGKHAARSRRHAPRRPRLIAMPSGLPVVSRRADGQLIVDGVQGPAEISVAQDRDPRRRVVSSAQAIGPFPADAVLTFTCIRCGCVSQVAIRRLFQTISENQMVTTLEHLTKSGTLPWPAPLIAGGDAQPS